MKRELARFRAGAMMESLFKDLPPVAKDERDERQNSAAEDPLVSALPAVEKIVGRKTALARQIDALPDIVQEIVLRLLRWRDKYREKSERMSPHEWQAFAARAAYNELNRHFSGGKSSGHVPLDAAPEISSPESAVEGSSGAEVFSLVRAVWQEICGLSLRQRRALLLHRQELILYFLQSGIGDEELAKSLGVGLKEWSAVKDRLPLSDSQIADLVLEKSDTKGKSHDSLTRSIKKARHEARGRLRQKITRR